MIWWILGIGALLAVSKASQSSSTPQSTSGSPIDSTSPPGLTPGTVRGGPVETLGGGRTAPVFGSPIVSRGPFIFGGTPPKPVGPFIPDELPLPGPAVNAPQASTTLTDYQSNLASAFNAYANVYLNKNVSASTPVVGIPGSAGPGGGGNYYGSGGTGGGHGSIGCPLIGTEIITLGGGEFVSEEFETEEWRQITAGEFNLMATPTHELVTMRGRIRLSEVKVGDLVITKDGERKVSMIAGKRLKNTALRIHVPDSHLYFANGILSHNKA